MRNNKRKNFSFKMMTVILLSAVIFSFYISGCISPVVGGDHKIPRPDEEVIDAYDPEVSGSFNQFGLNIMEEILQEEENVFISPVSIAAALSMTYNGARGETKEAIAEALEIKEMEREKFNENNLALLYLLQEADSSLELYLANSLWMREGMEFQEDFIKRIEEYYFASVRELDFDSPEAADIMNEWVSDRTEGLIDDIIEPPIDPLSFLFLINAVYFQGDWTTAFDEEDTREDDFYMPGGEATAVPFMYRSDDLEYLKKDDFQSVRLPYGEEERMAMYVFLPEEGHSLVEFVREFDQENWRKWRNKFRKTGGDLYLPRFTMEYGKTLNDALKALGMEIAFDAERADFFEMVAWENDPRAFISEVKHKSFIEVNEKGTEAAAATSVEMELTSAPVDTFEMKVNRPFFFFIHDEVTDAILFAGTVADPSNE